MFEIGQIVEAVRRPKDWEINAEIFRRFITDESVVKEMTDNSLNDTKDGDLFEVCEKRIKKDINNIDHNLYLCKNLKNLEYSLFGESGLREHK